MTDESLEKIQRDLGTIWLTLVGIFFAVVDLAPIGFAVIVMAACFGFSDPKRKAPTSSGDST
jgi:hypothetical protein